MNELEILQKIKTSYQEILADKLVGIYVHGSIAFQCFNWKKSDIDFSEHDLLRPFAKDMLERMNNLKNTEVGK